MVNSRRNRDLAAASHRGVVSLAEMMVPAHALVSCAEYIRRTRFLTSEAQLRAGGELAAEALIGMVARPHMRRIPVLRPYLDIAVCLIRLIFVAHDLPKEPLCASTALRDPAVRGQVSHDFLWALDLHALIAEHHCFLHSA